MPFCNFYLTNTSAFIKFHYTCNVIISIIATIIMIHLMLYNSLSRFIATTCSLQIRRQLFYNTVIDNFVVHVSKIKDFLPFLWRAIRLVIFVMW